MSGRVIHVYEKLGFKREGIKREVCYFNHKYHDLLIMSCLYKDFIDLHSEVLAEFEII